MPNDITVDLIIDGNYILQKNTYSLHKNNSIRALLPSLEATVLNYKKWHPFSNVYIVSDSREKSWRKDLHNEYKSHRKKDSEIDWNFVFETYAEFKDIIKTKGIKILEFPHIEGDDWISFLVSKANLNGRSTLIVSNDYDIKQIVNYSIDPLWINIMCNEIFNKEKIFLPNNYQLFLNNVSKLNNNDIFNLNDNSDFLKLLKGFTDKYETKEVNSIESLMIKVISGDVSDNITSVWSVTKNGKKRGIGDKGAKNIYDDYLTEFGEINMKDPDLYENIADLICEKKKLNKSSMDDIKTNIKFNLKLIDLNLLNLPDDILQKMEKIYHNI